MRIVSPPIRSPEPTHSSSRATDSTNRFGRKRCGSSPNPTSASSSATACVVSSESGIASNTPRSCLITRTPSPSDAASAGSMTSSSSPLGVRTTVRDLSGRSGSTNRGTCASIAASSRIVIHGKPERSSPPRTNAHRRSPANPCQPTSTAWSGSGAIDFTG